MREELWVRADALAEAFVGLADTLVDDYNIIDLLNRLTDFCVRSLPISAAGILFSDQQDSLQVLSASNEQTRRVLQFQMDLAEGPGIECFRTSRAVALGGLDTHGSRWSELAAHPGWGGFRVAHAVPLRMRAQTIGVLNLFRVEPALLPAEDIRVSQALADMATIGILHERALSERVAVVDQLQFALNSRVIIEQAKGVLAERYGIEVGEAFTLLRRYARNNNLRLSEVAGAVVDGHLVIY